LEENLLEVNEGINEDEKLSRSKTFRLYFNTVKEIEKLIENKLLRNEGDVTEYAKQIGGGYNWIHSHQGTEYI
jgi:lipopolysaccharide biosynthesis protein